MINDNPLILKNWACCIVTHNRGYTSILCPGINISWWSHFKIKFKYASNFFLLWKSTFVMADIKQSKEKKCLIKRILFVYFRWVSLLCHFNLRTFLEKDLYYTLGHNETYQRDPQSPEPPQNTGFRWRIWNVSRHSQNIMWKPGNENVHKLEWNTVKPSNQTSDLQNKVELLMVQSPGCFSSRI